MQKTVCRSFALLKDDNADGFRFVETREGRPLPYGGEAMQIGRGDSRIARLVGDGPRTSREIR